jgi:hypothetical protein
MRVSADYPDHRSGVPCPLPRRIATGARVGCFPVARGLPRFSAGSASATSLSRPAQASLALRPVGLLNRPRRPLSQGFSPAGYPARPLASYQIKPTTIWVEPSSAGDPRRRGTLRNPGLVRTEWSPDGIVEAVNVAANGLNRLLAGVEDGPPHQLGFQRPRRTSPPWRCRNSSTLPTLRSERRACRGRLDVLERVRKRGACHAEETGLTCH